MAISTVKWFNSAKGFGFICDPAGGPDIFAHFSVIVMDGYKALKAGQMVSYDLSDGPKGVHAINIQALSDVTAPANTSKPRTQFAAIREEEPA